MKRLIFSIAILGALSAPALTSATTLLFTTPQTTASVGNPLNVAVTLNTENEVNAIGVALIIPPGLELVDTSNGNSIMSFWVEQPNYNRETRTLTFSGIIPGGFSGTGQLLKIILKADAPGAYTLSFDPAHSTLYQNGPNGTPESAIIKPSLLQVVDGATPTSVPAADTEPPEAFTPAVTHDPQLYNGAWTLIFATQDKGSGIAQYEVSESPVRRADLSTLSWTKAESPYRLNNQSLARYIYVRAIDEQGNVRIELFTLPRQWSWFEGLKLGILIAALVLFVFWQRTKKQLHVSS